MQQLQSLEPVGLVARQFKLHQFLVQGFQTNLVYRAISERQYRAKRNRNQKINRQFQTHHTGTLKTMKMGGTHGVAREGLGKR